MNNLSTFIIAIFQRYYLKTTVSKYLATTIILVVGLLCGVLRTAAASYDLVYNGVYYNYVSLLNRTVTVAGVANGSDIVIPSTIVVGNKTYDVINVDEFAFQGNKTITSVSLPESILELRESVFFNCSSLLSVKLPSAIKKIPKKAFYFCSALKTVVMPDSLEIIDDLAFCNTKLSSINIPQKTRMIGEWAFKGTAIESISLPTGITTIGRHAFSLCKLQSIIIPQSITSISEYMFDDCKSLQSITIPQSVTSIGKYAFKGCEQLQSIVLPNDVYSISRNAFEGCKSLKQVVLPRNAKQIDSQAFKSCSTLSRIDIPQNVVYIGDSVFDGCSNLLNMIIPPSVEIIGKCNLTHSGRLMYVLSSKTKISKDKISSAVVVPNIKLFNKMNGYCDNKIVEAITFEDSIQYSGKEGELNWNSNLKYNDLKVHGNQKSKELGNHFANIKVECWEDDSITWMMQYEYPYTIIPRELTVTSNDIECTYGEDIPQVTYSITGFLDGDNESVLINKPTFELPQNKNAGEYPLMGSGATADKYSFKYVAGRLKINKAKIFACELYQTIKYGLTDENWNIKGKLENNQEVFISDWKTLPVVKSDYKFALPVGEHDLEFISGELYNHEIASILSCKLTVEPREIKLIPGSYYITDSINSSGNNIALSNSKFYYDENPEFKIVNWCGFFIGQPRFETSVTKESDCGNYIVKVDISGLTPVNNNYILSTDSIVFKVIPRVLRPNTSLFYTRPYGQDNPEFKLTSFQGFVGGQSSEVLISYPIGVCNAGKGSFTGYYYDIAFKGGDAKKYIFGPKDPNDSYIRGTLYICKADPEIIWEQNLTNLAVGECIELVAKTTNNQPTTFESSNPSIVKIYSFNNQIFADCLKDGECFIRATYNGNVDYNAQIATKRVVVKSSSTEKPKLTIKQVPVGSLSTSVDWASDYIFTVVPEPEWIINSVSVNGIDYTSRYNTTQAINLSIIKEDTTVIISYSKLSDSVDEVCQSEIKVLGTQDGITITGAPIGDVIKVYDIEGRLLNSLEATEGDIHIHLVTDNIYIVRIGSFTAKVHI